MTVLEFLWAVLSAPVALVFLALATMAVVVLVAWALIAFQVWRGHCRWHKRVQDMQERQRLGARLTDHRYDPRLFRGRR